MLMSKIIFLKKKKSLACILARKVISKAPATTLPNTLLIRVNPRCYYFFNFFKNISSKFVLNQIIFLLVF